MLPAAVLAIAYLILRPPSADLAAQTFRADLFASHGFLLWNNYWYSGHYLPSYSVLYPPLGAALGPRLVGALSAVAAAGLFDLIARRRYGDRARLGTLWFGAATVTLLLSGRITFALGIAIGLGALLAFQRDRPLAAAALAIATGCASPVAGLFLVVVGLAIASAGQRTRGLILAAAALAPIFFLGLAFPEGGNFPFVFTAFLPVPLVTVAALWLIPPEERALRHGVVIYAALCIVLWIAPTPIGANAARLGALFAGPVLALLLTGRRPIALALLALPLLYWQWAAPIRDVTDALGDPSVKQGYYQPLLAELQRRTAGEPVRIQIPPSRDRGEAQYVAPHFALARGWLRQEESDDLDPFTNRRLTAEAYRSWLDTRGVSYVAVSDAAPDYLATDELALIGTGLPYLRQVWAGEHWRLYAVRGSPGLVSGPATLSHLGADAFSLDVRRPADVPVRVHFTSYWTVIAGDACVERDGDWTRVVARRPGPVSVAAEFSLGGLFGRDQECSG